jgi:hypothetical protein
MSKTSQSTYKKPRSAEIRASQYLDVRASWATNSLEPILLPSTVTGAVCHRILVNDLPVLLEHVPLHQR